MKPGRLNKIEEQLLWLRPGNAGRPISQNSFQCWEASWLIASELLRHVNELESALDRIITAPITDLPPAAKAVVIGLQMIAMEVRNGK